MSVVVWVWKPNRDNSGYYLEGKLLGNSRTADEIKKLHWKKSRTKHFCTVGQETEWV